MHVRLRSVLLSILLLLSIAFPLIELAPLAYATTPQGQVFGAPIYLKSTASDIAGYKTVSLTKPTSTTAKNLSVSASSGIYLIGKWISPFVVVSNSTIDAGYSFAFYMYANATVNQTGTMFAEFAVYRNSAEISYENTTDSELLWTSRGSCQIWQYKTRSELKLIKSDRIVFKLYFRITAAATYNLWYDFAKCASYFQDPTETRYVLKPCWTIGGTNNQKLSLNSPSSTFSTWVQVAGRTTTASAVYGIRVYNRTSAGAETEITTGTPVALVWRNVTGGYGAQSATWVSPNAAWTAASNCSLVVRYYCNFDSNGTWFLFNATTTEGLSASYFNSSTWTTTYYTWYSTATDTARIAFDGIEDSSDLYPTRIANIVYTSADLTAPKWYNPTQDTLESSGQTSIYLNWTDDEYLSGYSPSTNNTGAWVNSSWIFPTDKSLNITILNLTWNNTAGNKIGIGCYCNDTSNNMNYTLRYVTLIQGRAPFWYNPCETTTIAGTSCTVYLNWTDNEWIKQTHFATNNTGQWVNDSAIIVGAITINSSKTFTLNSTVGNKVGISWLCYDNTGYSVWVNYTLRYITTTAAGAWHMSVTWIDNNLVTRLWAVRSTWIINAQTRAWSLLPAIDNLTTRAWSPVVFEEDLITRSWQYVLWAFDEVTRIWQMVPWIIIETTRQWIDAITWTVDLITRTQWFNIATWTETLESLALKYWTISVQTIIDAHTWASSTYAAGFVVLLFILVPGIPLLVIVWRRRQQ